MLNQVNLIGNVGRNPDVRYTAGGQPVTNFSVATAERWVDKSGNKQEKTEWHDIVAWGKLAENVGKFVQKGSKVFVTGKIQTKAWTDKNGADRKTKEILANQVVFLSSNPNQNQEPGQGSADFQPQSESNNDVPTEFGL